MPFYNPMRKELPRSRRLEVSTYKNGLRHAIFSTSGSKYIGEWKNNQKNGKGIHLCSKPRELYQGDFENNLRHGFGVLSDYNSKVNSFQLKYRGTFVNGKAEGCGLRIYFKEGNCYYGSFACGKRNGYGQMWYKDGSFYNGDWLNGNRHGEGLLVRPDGNRYEGSWENNHKHGRGKYFFLTSGQLQKGIWKHDVPYVSEMTDIPYRQTCTRPTTLPIPKNCLVDPDEVLRFQQSEKLEIHQDSFFNEYVLVNEYEDIF